MHRTRRTAWSWVRHPSGIVAAVGTVVAVVLGLPTPARQDPDRAVPSTTATSSAGHWVGTWATGQQLSFGPSFDDVTLRLVVHTSVGGDALRIRLANTFGSRPLTIGAATVGIQQRGARLVPGSLRPLTFTGWPSVTIPEGAGAVSDPLPMPVPALSNLAVSLYLPTGTGGTGTQHLAGDQTSYVSTTGDHSDEADAANFPTAMRQWSFLRGIDVRRADGATIVALGDSVTGGGNSPVATNQSYPAWLARRLHALPRFRGLGVLNEGIGGNELLRRGALFSLSQPALDRIGRDVLLQSRVRTVIVLEGTNDILGPLRADGGQLIAGFRRLVTRLHDQEIRVLGGTIPPCSCYSPDRERTRETVNRWIRTSGTFDGVVDFDRALRDPDDPHRLRDAYHDPGEPLHPNAQGYRAMAQAVPLRR